MLMELTELKTFKEQAEQAIVSTGIQIAKSYTQKNDKTDIE